MKMEQKEIFKIKAEADTKHLLAKLNESEADALEDISNSEQKINELKVEIVSSKDKRQVLKQKLDQLKEADDSKWDLASTEFIESIEALEDKNTFKAKSEEWFINIRNIAVELKQDIKQKTAQW
jgi:hypothetical protein